MFGRLIMKQQQFGLGLADLGQIYRAPYRVQSGYGVGGFLLGLSKYLIPVIKKTGRILGEQAINTTKGILSDMGSTAIGRSNKSIRHILSDRSADAINNLSDKAVRNIKRKLGTQTGSGVNVPMHIKRAKKRKPASIPSAGKKRKHKQANRKKKQIKPKKKRTKRKKTQKKRVLDIFS